jgi:hypothetical protein
MMSQENGTGGPVFLVAGGRRFGSADRLPFRTDCKQVQALLCCTTEPKDAEDIFCRQENGQVDWPERFFAMKRNNNASRQHNRVMTLMDVIMGSNPVMGETMVPNRNMQKPMTAEAPPALFRSSVKASDVEVGRIMPRKFIMTNASPLITMSREKSRSVPAPDRGGGGFGNDDTSGSRDALEYPEEDEGLDVLGEQTGGGKR